MTTDNNWRIIQPVASSNIVLNPSAETTANFSAVSGATVTRVSTVAKYGLFSYRVQSVASGDGVQLTTTTATNVEHFVTVRVKKPFPTGLKASLNGNARTLVFIEKIDKDWDLLGIDFPAALANGATSVQILATASGDFNVDGVQVEPLNYWTTFIDGTQPGCAWLGPAHAAASERSGQSRAGGRSLDFFDEYGFRIHKIVGAGASSHSINIDSYAILPGGELNSDKVQSRDFSIIGEFIADTEQELHDNEQALEAAFQTDDNQLTLIRFNGATVQKEIAVRYDGGLEGDLSVFYGNISITTTESTKRIKFSEEASIQVIAPNPYWLEVGESAVDLDTNDSATFRIVAGRLKSTGQWSALGPPDAAGTYTAVHAIVEDDTYIYFGGIFANFDNIANADRIVRYHKQNGVYSALGTGTNGTAVRDMVILANGDLIVTGDFTLAGGVANTARIARWDGSTWSALGTGLSSNSGFALAVLPDGDIIVTGGFALAGGVTNTLRIARWDGTAWSALSTGLDSTGFALTVGIDGTLYVAGAFANAGATAAARIASWDGTAFSALGLGLDANALSLSTMSTGDIIVGGTFTTADSVSAVGVAQWNGKSFTSLGSGFGGANPDGYTLDFGPDDILYAGGDFDSAGGIDLADAVARWNQYTWAHLDIDFPGTALVRDIFASRFSDPVVEQNYDLYVGFSTTGTGTFAGAVTAVNDGSVQAFPKIVYARSGGTTATIETLRNERTGLELLFDYPLLDGETLIIDLDPLAKSITSSFFGSRLDAVLPNSDFGTWSLPRDNSNITSYINETGSPTLVHYIQWRDAYSGYN